MSMSPLTNQTSVVQGQSTPRTTPRTPTTPGSMRAMRPKPKQKLIRKSAGGMQKFWINKLALSDHAKRAFKRATRWYIQEKDNPGGLSSRQIEAKVKREYDGVGLHAATIWRYVNANIAGMSPLMIGVKGDLPPCVFKSLCVSFKSFVHIQQINSCQGETSQQGLILCCGMIIGRRC
jgi:hypothetical protein